MTATATLKVRRVITNSLGMRNFALIEESPERLNIKYVVLRSPSRHLDHMFGWLASEVAAKGSLTDRTIVYCQSRLRVGELYSLFASLVPKEMHKHFNMYHTNTEEVVQKRIVASFADGDGEIRILFATIAFGLGIDVKKVYTVVQVGHPTELGDLMQLSGRAGRDGVQSSCISIDFLGARAGIKLSEPMKEYMAGKTCRRSIIKNNFPANKDSNIINHNCCDICAQSCTCEEGGCPVLVPYSEQQFRNTLTCESSSEMRLVSVTDSEIDQVRKQLTELRASLLTDASDHLYTGEDMACGFSSDTLEDIIRDSHIVFPYDMFCDSYAFSHNKISSVAWNIVKTCISNYGDTSSGIESAINFDSSPSVSDEEDSFEGEYAEAEIHFSSELIKFI